MVGYVNAMTDMNGEPVSRTHQYRKVMKPLLERKRRARINRCLDELKDLMTSTFQADGENVAKLEKADILELTVRHLQKMQHQKSDRPDGTYVDKFKAGFRQCAVEVSQFLGGHATSTGAAGDNSGHNSDDNSSSSSSANTSVQMLHHLKGCITQLDHLPGAANLAAPPLLQVPYVPAAAPYANSVGSFHDDDAEEEEFDYMDEYDDQQQQLQKKQNEQQQEQQQQQQQQLIQQHQLQQQQQLIQHKHMQQKLLQLHELQHRITPPQSPADADADDDDEDVEVDGDDKEDENVWRPW